MSNVTYKPKWVCCRGDRHAAGFWVQSSGPTTHASMGCGGSTPEDVDKARPIDLDINKLERNKSGSAALANEPKPSQRMTSSGYLSDLQSDRPAFTHAFVHNHAGKHAQSEMLEKYETEGGTVLGRGACGSVVAVKHRQTGEHYAMKVVGLDTVGGSIDELKREIEIQRALDHPNICKIFESYEDKHAAELYIIMEICTGGSLVSRMKTHRHGYGEKAAATLVEKMLSAVIYCHHHGVVHRDIKLDNFIYEDEAEQAQLKLIDFGFAAEIAPGKESMWDQLGTPSYMAPELWGREESEYDSSVDMWALGVVTYMLLSGKRPFHHQVRDLPISPPSMTFSDRGITLGPFHHQDKKEKARMIRHEPLRFPSPEWDRISQEAKDFCAALMQKRPKDRLAASNAKDHAWIRHASTLHQGEDAAHDLARHNEIVESLQSFCEADDLKKLALEVIAFATPPSKLHELRDLFVKMDVDDSGTISLKEFKAAMALHPEVPQEKVEQMFHDMDIDHSGEVDYSEFLSATLSAQKHSNASIMAAFTTLDADGDGFITKPDLDTALDHQMSGADIQDMLEHADASGRVNFQVFKRIVLSGLSSSAKKNSIIDVANVVSKNPNLRSPPQSQPGSPQMKPQAETQAPSA